MVEYFYVGVNLFTNIFISSLHNSAGEKISCHYNPFHLEQATYLFCHDVVFFAAKAAPTVGKIVFVGADSSAKDCSSEKYNYIFKSISSTVPVGPVPLE